MSTKIELLTLQGVVVKCVRQVCRCVAHVIFVCLTEQVHLSLYQKQAPVLLSR